MLIENETDGQTHRDQKELIDRWTNRDIHRATGRKQNTETGDTEERESGKERGLQKRATEVIREGKRESEMEDERH